MSGAVPKAHLALVVDALRRDPPEGLARWTPAAIGRAQGLATADVVAAVRALRFAGKVDFNRLALTPSMLIDVPALQVSNLGESTATTSVAEVQPGARTDDVSAGGMENAGTAGETAQESQAKAGDETGVSCTRAEAPAEPVSRPAGGRTPAATSEPMDMTAGETAPVSEAAGRGHPPQRELGGDAWQATAHDIGGTVGGSVKPPSPDHESAAPPQVAAGEEARATPPAGVSSPILTRTDPTHGHSLSRDAAAALLAEIESYIARVGMPYNEFGVLALGFGGFVGLLRKRGSARSVAADRARAFMAAWPNGVTRDEAAALRAETSRPALAPAPLREAAPSPLVAAVRAEASEAGARRQAVRELSATVHKPISAMGFAVQAALLEQPEDGFAFLRRKWPALLGGVIAAAHDEGIGPGPMLARIIEQGLLCIADDAREGTA